MDLSKMIGQISKQSGDGKSAFDTKSLAAGAAAGGMVGLFANSRTARRMKRQAGNALRRNAGMAGLAVVGGLAYKAYSDHRVKQAQAGALAAPETDVAGFITDKSDANSEVGMLVIRAMISASSADGEIDADERDAIMAELKQCDLNKSAMGQIIMEMSAPATAEQIAQDVKSVEQAVQVYTAAHMAITLDTQEEEDFLSGLAASLELPDSLVSQIDETISSMSA